MQKGETKILLRIINEGAPKLIAKKINELLWSYQDANAFKNSTGQQQVSDEDMENAVFSIWKYLNNFDPFFDSPSTKPLLTYK
jgi:hypothetical protein